MRRLTAIEYGAVRHLMLPGDVIAFGGKGAFSNVIKWITRSTVSHVGVILQSKLLLDGDPQAGFLNQIIESTSLNGFNGVTISRLSDRLAVYDGEVWWLPLASEIRAGMDLQAFFDFCLHQNKKRYDTFQAILAGLHLPQPERYGRLFCSELVAGALEASGAVSRINASKTTPIELCRLPIFAAEYFQLAGRPKAI